MIKKSVRKLIKERTSIRTYKNDVLDKKTISILKDLISRVNKVGPFQNRIRYSLVILDDIGIKSINKFINYGFIKGAPAFIAGIMKTNNNYLIDFGYLMEDIILKTVGAGLETCWLGGSLKREAFKEKLVLAEEETLPAIFSVGSGAQKKRKFDNLIRTTLNGNNRKPWSHIFFTSENKEPLDISELGYYREVLEMVRLAPSSCNKQPWRIIKDKERNHFHFYFARDKLYSKSLTLRKRSDLQKMDIGIAMYHFENSASELNLSGAWKFIHERRNNKANFEYIISWLG